MEVKIAQTFWHRVANEKTTAELSAKYNSDNIIRNNKSLNLYSGEWVQIQVNDYFSHIVRPAETLKQIAEINCISKEKLMNDNDLKTDKLFIGQRLKIYK